MKSANPIKEDLFYTADHEWIQFRQTVAYTGICAFKLTGFREVHEIIFNELSGEKKQGDIIATIRYNEYRVEAHMPVDGKILQLNDALLSGDYRILLQEPESNGWIAEIIPSTPCEKKDLLLPARYRGAGKKNMPVNNI